MIHYGNLNSLRKFELITEEYKSITGKKGISLRILNFITKNQNSLRKILISLRHKNFITEKRSVFGMTSCHACGCRCAADALSVHHPPLQYCDLPPFSASYKRDEMDILIYEFTTSVMVMKRWIFEKCR